MAIITTVKLWCSYYQSANCWLLDNCQLGNWWPVKVLPIGRCSIVSESIRRSTVGPATGQIILARYWSITGCLLVNNCSAAGQLLENFLSTFGQRQLLDKVARTSCQLQFYWTRFPAASPILDTTGCTKSATALKMLVIKMAEVKVVVMTNVDIKQE